MKLLEDFLSEQSEVTIQTLANYIQQYIQEQWQPTLQQGREKLLRIYDQAGEGAAYGTYARLLFGPVQEQLKRASFSSSPGFPGTLPTSREWGPEERRERWMWCLVKDATGALIGTLVVFLVHDHTQFRVPSSPGALAIKETESDAIVQAVLRVAGQMQSEEE